MAETDDTAKLVEQLRALAHGTLIDPDPQDVADAAADVIEAQGARIAELEDERDAFQEQQNNLAALIPDEYDGDEYQGALIERFVRDAAGRFEQQVAERDALAAVIEKVRKACDKPLYLRTIHNGWSQEDYSRPLVKVNDLRAILAAAPSDILDDVKADVWDECIGAFVWCLANGDLNGALQYVGEHNPYRTEQGEQADEEAVVPWADVPAANKGMIANAARRTEQGEQSNED